MRLYLRCGEFDFKVEAGELPIEVSKHTGRQLGRYSIDVRLRGDEQRDKFLKAVSESGAQEINDDGSLVLRHFNVLQRSSSYQDEGPHRTVYSHNFELVETESLNLSKLVIDGISIEPYEYEEKISQDAVVINGKYRLPNEVDRQLYLAHGKPKYFEVLREGISNEPKMMRWGKTTWSPDGDHIKREFVLVEEVYDAEPSADLFQPEMSNMQVTIAKLMSENVQLRKLLATKGILTDDEVEDLVKVPKEQVWENLDLFYLVNDIDKP